MALQRDIPAATPRPLSGKTILVTRPANQAREFTRLLESQGARVLCVPVIEILPPERWDACDAAIGSMTGYDAVVVTSVNAARVFFARAQENMALPENERSPVSVYAVGEKTRATVETFGMPCHAFEGIESSRQLAEQLMTLHTTPARFLFPRGNLARTDLRDALTAAGHEIDEVEVYRTVPSTESGRIESVFSSDKAGIDAVTFFSPSAVDVFFDIMGGTFRPGCAIAVIGTTTAAAVTRRGLPVAIAADRPSAAALCTAVLRFFTKQKEPRVLPIDHQ